MWEDEGVAPPPQAEGAYPAPVPKRFYRVLVFLDRGRVLLDDGRLLGLEGADAAERPTEIHRHVRLPRSLAVVLRDLVGPSRVYPRPDRPVPEDVQPTLEMEAERVLLYREDGLLLNEKLAVSQADGAESAAR